MIKAEKRVRNFVIGIKILLYIVVSIISTIHVIDFFVLTNPYWLAVSLAIAFEIGAAASLAAILVLPKAKQSMVWLIFIILTLTQAMGNMYFAYDNAQNFESWMELFGLTGFTVIEQKRILAIASGAILPVIALGFIKSLVDYLKPDDNQTVIKEIVEDNDGGDNKPAVIEPITNTNAAVNTIEKPIENIIIDNEINNTSQDRETQKALDEENIKLQRANNALINELEALKQNLERSKDTPDTISKYNSIGPDVEVKNIEVATSTDDSITQTNDNVENENVVVETEPYLSPNDSADIVFRDNSQNINDNTEDNTEVIEINNDTEKIKQSNITDSITDEENVNDNQTVSDADIIKSVKEKKTIFDNKKTAAFRNPQIMPGVNM